MANGKTFILFSLFSPHTLSHYFLFVHLLCYLLLLLYFCIIYCYLLLFIVIYFDY